MHGSMSRESVSFREKSEPAGCRIFRNAPDDLGGGAMASGSSPPMVVGSNFRSSRIQHMEVPSLLRLLE